MFFKIYLIEDRANWRAIEAEIRFLKDCSE